MFKFIIIALLLSALLVPSMMGYVKKANLTIENKTPDKVETMDSTIDNNITQIDQDIVFIKSYSNWASGYQYNGSFVDKNGNVYEFDFSDKDENITCEQLLDEMTNIMNSTTDKVSKFGAYEMNYMYELLQKVDENAEFTEKSEACDYGQVSLYGIRYDSDGKPYKVLINSYGDVRREPLDKDAQKLSKCFGSDKNL
ncbi:MAG: hypothetical protein Q4F95_09085 [Oscillospiraceae bacterium]|nr:hypothetical protein [Oscillospiraceae bacterium]